MSVCKADIVVFGGGIAGLWVFHRLRKLGYDALLLESNSLGSGQTIASQGILHSGLKYALAGQVNALAKSISHMPDIWRKSLAGQGPVNLSKARLAAPSQKLLIPKGFVGGVIKIITEKALGDGVQKLEKKDWPEGLAQSGFDGSVIDLNEPVLNIPSVLRALADPYSNSIRKIRSREGLTVIKGGDQSIKAIECKGERIEANQFIFTAASGNMHFADALSHTDNLEIQRRPLLMAMVKNAPFSLFGHLVGTSDKPIATITTHVSEDGGLIWYIGGQVAEREKTDPPEHLYKSCERAFQKFFPNMDLNTLEWAALPIDRVEGKASGSEGWLPDTPTVHKAGNAIYGWPTKLTFAPLLSEEIFENLDVLSMSPQRKESDWSSLPLVSYARPPWDSADWKRR